MIFMPYIYVLLAVLGIIGIIFIEPVRDLVCDAIMGTCNVGIGLTRRLIKLLHRTLATLSVLYALFVVLCYYIGAQIHCPGAGLIFGMLFPVWFLFWTISGIASFFTDKAKGRSTGWIGIALVFVSVFLLLSWMFPNSKEALGQYGAEKDVRWSNNIKGEMLQNTPKGVLLVTVNEDTNLCDGNGTPIKKALVKTGDELMTTSLEKIRINGSPDYFIEVMMKNLNNDYSGGIRGYISTRKVTVGTIARNQQVGQDENQGQKNGVNNVSPAAKDVITSITFEKNVCPQEIEKPLSKGGYKIFFTPTEAAKDAQISVLLSNGKIEQRLIEKNHITIGEEKCFAFWTPIVPSTAKIYAD